MEHEPVTRELSEFDKELAERWQVYPGAVKTWVGEHGLIADNIDLAAEWAVRDENMELIMEAKRKFFEDHLFPPSVRPEPAKPPFSGSPS